MKQSDANSLLLTGPAGALVIHADDTVAVQLAMLVEGQCLGLGPTKAAHKYGYSKQRFFQVLHAFQAGGIAALTPKKRGPHHKRLRTEVVISQIVRHRFLDPDASAAVIAQKLRQSGLRISVRSVERTITEQGLPKKTL